MRVNTDASKCLYRWPWPAMIGVPLVCLVALAGFERSAFAGETDARPWLDAQGRMAGELAPIHSDGLSSLLILDAAQPEAADSIEKIDLAAGNPFGQAGSWRWALIGGGAFDVNEDGENYNLHIAASKFFTNDFNVSFELGGMYFEQSPRGEDTGGVNANMLLRWHFVNQETYSFYVDAGVGLLYVDDKVPFDGANFNFTPQAGVGVSLEVDDARDIRIFGGVRWFHVSNANLAASDNNPGRDAILGYVGLDFPIR